MKSILEQLYYGNISPWENISPQKPEYRMLWKKASEKEDYLAGKLPAEEDANFTEYQDIIRNAYCMEVYESFSYGFRLGMSLLWEVVSTDL